MRRSEAKRSYDDACGTAHALELIGERWALLVLRELLLGPRRFSEMRADLPGISANVLTQRLSELEQRGLVRRRRLPPPASVQVYEATEWGLETAPLIRELGRWAARSPAHDPSLPLSAVSLFLSFRTMIDPVRARGLVARIGFCVGSETYVATLDDGAIAVDRGDPAGADVVFEGAARMIAAAVYGGQPLDGLVAAGALSVAGDRAVAERFVTLFPLPPKVEPAE